MTFALTVLGSNSAIPTANRNPTAHLLNVNERFFLIDCGEGTQIQLRKYRFKIQRIQRIFISHLHGDHYFGLIGLITTMQLLGREKELHIYSPEGLQRAIETQFDVSGTRLKYPVYFHSFSTQHTKKIFEDESVAVSTIPLKHGIGCCGFLFCEKPKQKNIQKEAIAQYNIPLEAIHKIKNGHDFTDENGNVIPNSELTLESHTLRSYAYCSDTCYDEKIIPLIEKVDLLFHEATFLDEMKERAKETLHSTAKQAATIAHKAGAKRLIIGHFSSRYKDIEPFMKEAKTVFENTELAIEGKKYEVRQEEINMIS